jgi:Arc/MetJ-type ribon-helix-helix transcriptional regulator
MATVQVQVRVPKKVVQEIDRWIAEGRFANRSEAIKTVLTLYEEREGTREFYRMLLNRSEQAKKKPDSLIPLEEIS